MIKHGLCGKPEYHIWAAMRQRCNNPRCRSYRLYGARGIKVCERWNNSVEAFIEDMGFRPSALHSLDRMNNDGDYEPSNCRWATQTEQSNNTRVTTLLTFKGETKTLHQWCEILKLPPKTIETRIRIGLDAETALTRPIQVYRVPPLNCARCDRPPELRRKKEGVRPFFFYCPNCRIAPRNSDGRDAYDARVKWNRSTRSLIES
jgi:hypothetical protein